VNFCSYRKNGDGIYHPLVIDAVYSFDWKSSYGETVLFPTWSLVDFSEIFGASVFTFFFFLKDLTRDIRPLTTAL